MLSICIGINTYDYVKKDTGERKQGAALTYLLEVNSDGRKGFMPLELRLPLEKASLFPHLPGVYDLDITMIPRRGGGVDHLFANGRFLKALDFSKLLEIKEKVAA